MDKASKVIRRSSVRLRGLSSGHGSLHMIISQITDVRQTFKAFTMAQSILWEDIQKWTCQLDNEAIRTTFANLSDLSILWTEVQRDFSDTLKQFRNCFDLILEGERQVDQSRIELSTREETEYKARKEVQKSHKKMNQISQALEIQLLKEKLVHSEKMSHLARLEVMEKARENEAVRMIRTKEGFTKMISAYIEMTSKAAIVFKTQKRIAIEIPDVQDKALHHLKYGGNLCADLVQQAKESVRLYREDSFTHNRAVDAAASSVASPELPPPYSPLLNNASNPFDEQGDNHTFRNSFHHPSAPTRSLTSLNSTAASHARNNSFSPSAYPNISSLSESPLVSPNRTKDDLYQCCSEKSFKGNLDHIPEKEFCSLVEMGSSQDSNDLRSNCDSLQEVPETDYEIVEIPVDDAKDLKATQNRSVDEETCVQIPSSELPPLAKSSSADKIQEKLEKRLRRKFQKLQKAKNERLKALSSSSSSKESSVSPRNVSSDSNINYDSYDSHSVGESNSTSTSAKSSSVNMNEYCMSFDSRTPSFEEKDSQIPFIDQQTTTSNCDNNAQIGDLLLPEKECSPLNLRRDSFTGLPFSNNNPFYEYVEPSTKK